MLARPIRASLVAALFVLALTSLVVFAPFLRFAYRSETAHVAIETAAALVALLAAFLAFGRFRMGGRLGDLLLAASLVVLLFGSVLLSAAVVTVTPGEPVPPVTWGALAVPVVGASTFAAAAVLPASMTTSGRRAAALALAICLVLPAALALAAVTLVPALPRAPTVALSESAYVHLAEPYALFAFQAVTGLLFAIAAVGCTVQSMRRGDVLLEVLAIGSVLAGGARLN